jgi:hypothetical protein
VFFEKGKVYSIRVDPPFAGDIGSVKLGDPDSKITKTFGKPIKESKLGLLTTYMYYFDDVTTTRFVVNNDGELETVFFSK